MEATTSCSRSTTATLKTAAAITMLAVVATCRATFAMSPELKPGEEALETKTELHSSGVHATLDIAQPGATVSVGGSAFVTIVLANRSKAARIGAELALTAEVGELVSVAGQAVETLTDGARTLARVRDLRKGKPRQILVELRLGAVESAGAARAETLNRLKIALRRLDAEPDAAPDETSVTWPAADCAAGFYGDIVAIRDRNGEAMPAALKAARTPDKTRPGRWLFRPGTAKSVKRRVCARWIKTWLPLKGRYERRCTRHKTVRRTVTTTATLTKSEAAVYRFAAPFVRSRAIDRQLSVKQNEGWVSQRVATDLRGYLKQDKHPAICTGALQLVDYFSGKMDSVRKRGELIASRAREARALAAQKTLAARDAIAADPGGHPGWGAAPLEFPSATETPSTKDLTFQVASLSSDEELVAAVRDAESGFAALRVMHASLQEAAKDLDPATRRAIHGALGAVEAADYLSVVEGHYAALGERIDGSLTRIKEAHERNCLCAS